MASLVSVDGDSEGSKNMRVLVVRASFSSLGGAERELLTALREWGNRWDVTVATLSLPTESAELAKGLNVNWVKPNVDIELPQGGLTEITGKASKVASRAWENLEGLTEAISNSDVIHISVCRGSLEILPLIPEGIGIHYHCLEPPRWLYEDVLHRHIDGRNKRPPWMTRLLFRKQKKDDMKLVKQLLSRPGTAISGNSHHVQSNLGKFYNLSVNPNLKNGEPPERDSIGRAMGPTVLMHVVDLNDWPKDVDQAETNAQLPLEPDSPYVVTVGRLGWVKGAWETLQSLKGTGLGLAQVGGGDAADKSKLEAEAKRLNVPLWLMPRLDQSSLRKLIRGSVAMVSHAHGEPFGLTPIEAMAVGTPALFVDEGGFHYTMSNSNSGRLLPRPPLGANSENKKMAAWHSAYVEAQNSESRSKWAEAGRRHVEGSFTMETQAIALENLLQDCIEMCK